MRIDHIALWTTNLDRCTRFYVDYFGATVGSRYVNATKGFESCFISFGDGARIEVMTTTKLSPVVLDTGAQRMGTHSCCDFGRIRTHGGRPEPKAQRRRLPDSRWPPQDWGRIL